MASTLRSRLGRLAQALRQPAGRVEADGCLADQRRQLRLKARKLGRPDLPLPLIAQLAENRFPLAQHLEAERGDLQALAAGVARIWVTGHHAEVNGTRLHYVAAGTSGSPVLLVHGFPETWWTFRKLIPLLAASHRVFAVDLRGFGDPGNEPGEYGSKISAEDLHRFVGHLGVGPVHLTGQDISGATVFRLAATHPEDVLSFTAIEMGLPGFGLETLADITHGGT
jgi:hypothetical protein